MKKVLICMLIMLVSVGAFASWTFDKAVGSSGESGQYIDVDSQGDVWVTNYGTPGTYSGVAIYDSEGNLSTTITDGQISGSPTAFATAGGVACDTDNGIVYCVSYGSKHIFKFNDSTNAPMDGIDLAGVTPNAPGDVAMLTSGSQKLLVLVNKVSAEWGVLDPTILAPTSYIVQFGVSGWHLNRGCGVDDTNKNVYLGDESANECTLWEQTEPGVWVQGTSIDTTGSGQSASEVDDNGNVYVSCTASNEIKIYDNAGSLVETVTDEVYSPRGCGFGVGKLYNVRFTGDHEMLGIYTGETGVGDWLEY